MSRQRRGEQGFSLVLSLIILTVLSVLMVATYQSANAFIYETVYRQHLAQSHAIAEAGIEDALYQLYLSPSWTTGFTQKAFSDGSYTVTIAGGASPVITSTGYSASIMRLGAARTQIQATTQFTKSTTTLCGTYSGATATINGTADAYDSAISTAPTTFGLGGHLCSNTSVVILDQAKVTVNMDVDYYSGTAPKASDIGGIVVKSTFTRTLPLHDGTAYATTNDNGKLPIAYYTAGTKTLSIPTNIAVTMTAGNYYLNVLTINGNLRIDPTSGPVTIYMNGNFTLSTLTGSGNGEITNLSGIPSKFMFYPQGTRTITLKSKAPLYAIVDGRSSTLSISQTIYGNLIGSAVTINSGYNFHFDMQAATTAAPAHAGWVLSSWSENK